MALFIDRLVTRQAAAVCLAATLAIGAAPGSASQIVLRESGSMAMAPLVRAWTRDYAEARPDVRVTVAATGSRQGTADAFAGTVQIGTSDTYMSDAQAASHPGFIDIAVAVSAVEIAYDLPGLEAPLNLDGPTLAAIFRGDVRAWDDKAIAELNPDVALSHAAIVPVRRAADAGETSVLARYLAISPSEEEYATLDAPDGAWGETAGLRADAVFPDNGHALQVADDDGMIETLAKIPYSIGYIAFPFADRAARAGLGAAAMRSHAGEFLRPDTRTLAAAAAAVTLRTPADERISLVDAPGSGCYPLITYEYAVVAKTWRDADEAAALRDFLNWAIARDAESFERVEAAHLVAMPASTWLKSLSQIDLVR